jgi:predicted acyltransferase
MPQSKGLLNISDQLAVPVSGRILSIDVFRGATIAAMFLVDGQGGTETYAMLRHSEWSGLTFTDCIAPCFMWIVGVSMCISMHKRVMRGDTPAALLKHLLWRAATLFGIGVALNVWLPAVTALVQLNVRELDSWLLMGTLQRIALGYLIGALFVLRFPTPVKQLIFAGALLAAYTGIFYLAPAPGFAPGDFSHPGNAISYLDQRIFGTHSNLSHPILNALPAAAMVLLGSLFGGILIHYARQEVKLRIITGGGALLLIGGMVLERLVPITYRLWTASFVLVTGGAACLVFALFYWVVDVKGLRLGIKWLWILGLNPIVMWVLAVALKTSLGAKGWINGEGLWRSVWTILFEIVSLPQVSLKMNSMLFALLFAGFLYTVAYGLSLRKILIRI